jgi:hypothetical protein
MTGPLWIEFAAGEPIIPTIFAAIDEAGFVLRGVRLVPSLYGERGALMMDFGACEVEAELCDLEDRLRALHASIEVIHRAGRRGERSR